MFVVAFSRCQELSRQSAIQAASSTSVIVDYFKQGGVGIDVITYPSECDDGYGAGHGGKRHRGSNDFGPIEQRREQRRAGMRPFHVRFIEAERDDGTRFRVLLERGLDFIDELYDSRQRRRTRQTRRSYLVIKDPV